MKQLELDKSAIMQAIANFAATHGLRHPINVQICITSYGDEITVTAIAKEIHHD